MDRECTLPNRNGFKIITLVNDLDYTVINNGDSTRIAEVQGQKNSAIDLTLVSPRMPTTRLKWETFSDCLGSDHRPQIISLYNENIVNEFSPLSNIRYNTDKADPETFKAAFSGDCEDLKQLPTDKTNGYDELANRIIDHIIDAANKSVPNNKKKKKKKKKKEKEHNKKKKINKKKKNYKKMKG